MADQAEYADRLRETLLALAIVPIAGFDAATYWLKESLERTSRFGADVIASTALARFTRPSQSGAGTEPDPVAEVLARDLLDAARIYVRSMVRLPADSGVYFTGELERRLNALLERIQPVAQRDPEAYADAELQRLLQELDRLFVVVRAGARRSAPASSPPYKEGAGPLVADTLVANIDALRKGVRAARPKLAERKAAPLSLDAAAGGPVDALRAARAQTKARTRLRQALRDAEALVPEEKEALARLDALIEQHFPSRPMAPPTVPPPKEGG
jgi:hypothetical protein